MYPPCTASMGMGAHGHAHPLCPPDKRSSRPHRSRLVDSSRSYRRAPPGEPDGLFGPRQCRKMSNTPRDVLGNEVKQPRHLGGHPCRGGGRHVASLLLRNYGDDVPPERSWWRMPDLSASCTPPLENAGCHHSCAASGTLWHRSPPMNRWAGPANGWVRIPSPDTTRTAVAPVCLRSIGAALRRALAVT